MDKMGVWYIIENNRVDNVIIADSKEIALQVGHTDTVLEETEDFVLGMNWRYVKELDKWYNPVALYPSWQLDENYDWQPPVEKPDGDYYWDEENKEWAEVEESE